MNNMFIHNVAIEAIEENKRLIERIMLLELELKREVRRNDAMSKQNKLYKEWFDKYPTDKY
jgi:hypothetical protein